MNKIYLIFHLRGSEFDSDLKHSGKEYIYITMDKLHISCCKSHLQVMSLFLSSCFSSQTRTVLVKFYYNAAVRRFWKTLEKLQGNDCDANNF